MTWLFSDTCDKEGKLLRQISINPNGAFYDIGESAIRRKHFCLMPPLEGDCTGGNNPTGHASNRCCNMATEN